MFIRTLASRAMSHMRGNRPRKGAGWLRYLWIAVGLWSAVVLSVVGVALVIVLLISAMVRIMVAPILTVAGPVMPFIGVGAKAASTVGLVDDDTAEVLDQLSGDERRELENAAEDDPTLNCLLTLPVLPEERPEVRLLGDERPLLGEATVVIEDGEFTESVGRVVRQVPGGADAAEAMSFYTVALAGGTSGWDHFTAHSRGGSGPQTEARFFPPGTDLEPYSEAAASLAAASVLGGLVEGDDVLDAALDRC